MRFLGFIDRLYDKKISTKGLAVFRICFATTLFFEVLRIFRYRYLYFDPMPYIEVATFDYTIPLLLWIVTLVFVIFGLFTRLATIINYGFTYWLINALGIYEYHMDYTYLGVGFLMMLVPLARSFSIDQLLVEIKNSNHKQPFIQKQETSVMYYFLLLFFGLGMVYFDSIFFKVKCMSWMNGLGMWLPASLPHFTIFNDQWLLNQEYIIKAFGYLTFAFEIVFPFFFFIKRFRLPLLTVGLALHIGILVEFPIPFFALGAIAIYVLMVPVSFWERLQKILLFKKPKFYVPYNPESNSSVKKKIIISHFDIFNCVGFKEVKQVPNHIAIKKYSFYHLFIKPETFFSEKTKTIALKTVFAALFFLQINISFNFPLSDGIVSKVTATIPSSKPTIQVLKTIKYKLKMFSHKSFGITKHGVFVDSHFKNYNTVFTLTYKDEFLPMLDKMGMPEEYLLSGVWLHYTFRVNKPDVLNSLKTPKKGLPRYAAFWAHQNGIDLKDASFKIMMKKVRVNFEWEKDLLKKNLATPWEEVGYLNWQNSIPEVLLNENKIKAN